MTRRLAESWYQTPPHWLNRLLAPAAYFYQSVVKCRRWLYKKQWLKCRGVDCPVIVIGNITVGGSGKTPMVIWLAEELRQAGYKPAVISRGYGGLLKGPVTVGIQHSAREVGDEPLLISKRCPEVPVIIDSDRPRAARHALSHDSVDCIISDDGLQHYALARDIEIALVNGAQGLGNGYCLPAGPLREPASRLDSVDYVVYSHSQQGRYRLKFDYGPLTPVNAAVDSYMPQPPARIHAVAGIAHPTVFFDTLRHIGYSVIPHAWPDHHQFKTTDLDFDDGLPIVMTEKDAVRCELITNKAVWCLPLTAWVEGRLFNKLDARLKALICRLG